MKEAGDHKEMWYNKVKDKGLGAKLAIADRGEVGGIVDALFIDEKRVRTGPPLSYEKIKKLIRKKI